LTDRYLLSFDDLILTDYSLKIALLVPALITLFWFVELLFSSGENSKAKKHLAFFMLCGFFSMYGGYLYFTGLFEYYALGYFIISTFSFAQLPAFYLYLKSLIKPSIARKTYIKHFTIPMISGFVAVFFLLILFSLEEGASMFKNYFAPETLTIRQKWAYYFDISFRNLFVLMGIFYLVLIHRQVKTSFKKLLNFCADADSKNPSWITIANLLYFVITIFAFVLFNLTSTHYNIFKENYLFIPYILLGILFFLIGFKGNRQELFVITEEEENLSTSEPLSDEIKTYLINNLERAIKNDQVYLKHDICLPELAKQVGTNRYYLSKLINSEFNMNFSDFINGYRIQNAVEMIETNYNEISLSEIATKSGFKSYISFSRNFQRQVNKSPEAFAKSLFIKK
jgi:AraC-like DNA-binding protein